MSVVLYASADLELLCLERDQAVRRLGLDGAKKLGRRIKELETATDIGELLQGPGQWHPLAGDRAGTYAGNVTGGDRIIVALTEVETWTVLEIVNYHRG